MLNLLRKRRVDGKAFRKYLPAGNLIYLLFFDFSCTTISPKQLLRFLSLLNEPLQLERRSSSEMFLHGWDVFDLTK